MLRQISEASLLTMLAVRAMFTGIRVPLQGYGQLAGVRDKPAVFEVYWRAVIVSLTGISGGLRGSHQLAIDPCVEFRRLLLAATAHGRRRRPILPRRQ